VIEVEAKFYNDPHIPDDTPNETMWELWEYEVVEVFLLGPTDHYLEIEISPKGQYLLLELNGTRNVIRDRLPLYKKNYLANINSTTSRWRGRAVIPNCYLPRNIDRFNAYGIHGSNDARVYKSLFPTTKGEFEAPDFHRLTHFGELDFASILPGNEDKNIGNRRVISTFLVLVSILPVIRKY